MANKLVSGQVFSGKGDRVMTAVVYSAASGSATLQILAGNDPDNDNWVAVTDGALTASGDLSYHFKEGHKYRFVLTGDAEVWI